MKNTIKRALSIMLVAVMLFGAAPLNGFVDLELERFGKLFSIEAEAATPSGTYGDNINWTLDTDTGVLEITGTGAMIDYNYSVSSWRSYSKHIKTVKIAEGITSIGYNAFGGCSKLTSVTIPDSVTSIGDSAFAYCKNLTTIVLADSITSIGYDSFYDTAIYNDETKWENSVLYIGNYLIKAKNTISGVYSIKEGTRLIADSAFYNCYHLMGVTIPDSVIGIGDRAFSSCYKLISITIPDSVTSIGDYAFYSCSYLTSITIPESVIRVGNYAFSDCSKLTSINMPDSIKNIGVYAFYDTGIYNDNTKWINSVLYIGNYLIRAKVSLEGKYSIKGNTKAIADGAFFDCSKISSVTIPNGITNIGYRLFYNCANLKNVNIPNGVVSIGNYAFWGCESLPSVIIPNSTTQIGEYAFENCHQLKSATIPSSVKEIGACTFSRTSLATIDLPNSVEIIGDSAFANIETATELTVPESVKHIGKTAFANNTALKKINFNAVNANDVPDNYSYYYGDIFANCGSLTDGIELVFGDNVKKIPAFMFEVGSETAHPNIKNVVIGSNVTEIGDSAFRYCGSIENVKFGEKVETIGEYAFGSCVGLESLALPESLRTISDSAFYSCNSLTEITIPQNVESVGRVAFGGCPLVETVNYNATNCVAGYMLSGCNGVKTVNIGNNVETVSAYAFTGCGNLEKAYVPDIVIQIDSYAFFGCGNVAIVCKNGSYANVFAVQNGIKYILENNATGTAFEIRNDMLLGYSGSAQNIVLPSDISSVGLDAFKGNGTVKSIEIPYSVSKIYSGAFANCSNLERVIIPFTVTDISASAFTGTNTKIYCYYNSYAYNYAVANGIPYELITVTLSANSVNIVETQSVTVDAVPSVTLASGIPLVWKSSNPAVASVDSMGNIIGNSVGNTTVGIYDLNGNMLDECSVTVGEKIEIEFEEPSTDTLKYGEKMVLHINTAGLPEGSTVKWTTSDGKILKIGNENATCAKHINCITCTIESVGNGSAEVIGTVVDKDGNPVIQNGKEITVAYQVNSKAGFFDKIIAFFKKLFGLLKTYQQSL